MEKLAVKLFLLFSVVLLVNAHRNGSTIISRVSTLSQGRSASDSKDRYQLREAKWYIGGKRQNGDILQAQGYDITRSQQAKDVSFEIVIEPQRKFYITYISLLVDQSSSIGQSYIEDGGIGKNYMTLIIEAKETTFLEHQINVYGRDYQ